MNFSWRAALRSSELWSRGPKGLRPRYSPAGGLTGHRHATPGFSRLLNTQMGWSGPQIAWSRPDIVTFPGKDRKDREITFNFGRFFLRENCQCPKCIHPDTMQRTSDTFSIPQNVKIESIEHSDNIVKIKWSDKHTGLYSYAWLHAHSQKMSRIEGTKPVTYPKSAMQPPRQFTPVTDPDQTPRVKYDDVMSDDESLHVWLTHIWDQGFCFVDDVPVNPEATQFLIERIAFIRNTHYGGFWDFTADLTFKDTAYTNEFLGAHTDNTYFTDPARLQLFHLLSHTEGSGGENLLVDGFAAAAQLRLESPEDYAQLVNHRHPWHASGNEDTCIQPSAMAPVFSMHTDLNKMYQIRWNNYDRAPKTNWSALEQTVWYRAARHYNEILQSKEMWTKLKPGSALMFDNWRMLHGRSEFTGKRRMCGGYVNNDDYISRLRLLKFGRKEVLDNLGNVRNKPQNPYWFI
ncbi:Taurine catabolism dioxygenase TauD/TfdA [Penicillium camemberti]|uniref:Trimethyllysine dioxygenase n=1 Tax=Penicillium camemberti (strain FM 013) TaxID=1429867 RepID=A0A0G4PM07_PENC3|nr:Taurine catabolism dioxygenase TauD/TfdA [Penicillium camemberti]